MFRDCVISTAEKGLPENNTCTRCNPFISKLIEEEEEEAAVDVAVVVAVVVEEEEEGASKPRASFICGTDSPALIAIKVQLIVR